MNDDELIERLRRTLHAEADALTPGRGTPRVSGRHRRRPARPFGVAQVRPFGVPPRVVAGLAAAAVVVAAVAVAVSLRSGPHTHVAVVGSPGGPTTVPSVESPRVTVPKVATSPTTTSPAPATTAPAPVVTRLGADFVPLSVTFVPASTGWILGLVPCSTGSCAQIGTTSDHGRTWAALADAPVVAGLTADAATGMQRPDLQIRFADAEDGWVYGNVAGSPVAWSTHDGGGTWKQVSLPAAEPGSRILALETAGGDATAVVASAGHTYVVDTTPTGDDRWRVATTVTSGSAPVTAATASLVLQGAHGWMVGVDGATVRGAELRPDGAWTTWTPPCASLEGTVVLAASSAADLVAVCDERSALAGATPLESVWGSVDGGASFQQEATVSAADGVAAIASSDAAHLVGVGTANTGTLVASADGGSSWTRTWADAQAQILQVGFEDSTQGIAVAATASGGGYLLMTTDAGQSWYQVDLQV